MTPLYRFFERILPAYLAPVAVSFAYAAMILALLLFQKPPGEAIIYLDVVS